MDKKSPEGIYIRRDRWEIDGKKVWDWLVKNELSHDAALYSRAEWWRRGEKWMNSAAFVVTTEGPLYEVINGHMGRHGAGLEEKFTKMLAALGYHYELGTAWMIGFYDERTRSGGEEPLFSDPPEVPEAEVGSRPQIHSGKAGAAEKKKPAGIDYAKLERDARAAIEVGKAAVRAAPSGGTCNFDKAVFITPTRRPDKKAEAVLAGLGMHPYYWGRGEYHLGLPGGTPQGSPQTAAADAITRSMKAAGWTMTTHYAMD
jgi:hypothetical protein